MKVDREMVERLKWQHGGADIMGEPLVKIRHADGEVLRSLAEAVLEGREALEWSLEGFTEFKWSEKYEELAAALRRILDHLEDEP